MPQTTAERQPKNKHEEKFFDSSPFRFYFFFVVFCCNINHNIFSYFIPICVALTFVFKREIEITTFIWFVSLIQFSYMIHKRIDKREIPMNFKYSDSLRGDSESPVKPLQP